MLLCWDPRLCNIHVNKSFCLLGGLEMLSACPCGNHKRLLTALPKRYPRFGGLCWVCSKCSKKYYHPFDEHSVFAKIVGKNSSWSPCDFFKVIEGLVLTTKIKDISSKTGVGRMFPLI